MSKPALAEVVTLFEKNASDIPAMLREAADNIEKWRAEGETSVKAMVAISVDDDGDLAIYGWGATDSLHSLATLQMGVVKLSNQMLADD